MVGKYNLVMGAITEDDGLCSEFLAQAATECFLKDHMERLAPAVRKVIRANGGNRNTTGKRES